MSYRFDQSAPSLPGMLPVSTTWGPDGCESEDKEVGIEKVGIDAAKALTTFKLDVKELNSMSTSDGPANTQSITSITHVAELGTETTASTRHTGPVTITNLPNELLVKIMKCRVSQESERAAPVHAVALGLTCNRMWSIFQTAHPKPDWHWMLTHGSPLCQDIVGSFLGSAYRKLVCFDNHGCFFLLRSVYGEPGSKAAKELRARAYAKDWPSVVKMTRGWEDGGAELRSIRGKGMDWWLDMEKLVLSKEWTDMEAETLGRMWRLPDYTQRREAVLVKAHQARTGEEPNEPIYYW